MRGEKQYEPGSIHYCAVDVLTCSTQKPIIYVTDHYRGYDGFYQEFKAIADKFDVAFIVAGGEIYQADGVHCPIFSAFHLMMTANDPQLLARLESVLTSAMPSKMPWSILPPHYMVHAQSFKTLLAYVEQIKEREHTTAKFASPLLNGARFDRLISYSLVANTEGKLQNKGIKLFAKQLVDELLPSLRLAKPEELITLCYQEQYPRVGAMLKKALQYSTLPEQYTEEHPLFELAFCHAHVLEVAFNNPKLAEIFSHSGILFLMQNNIINAGWLLEQLVSIGKEVEPNKGIIDIVWGNLSALNQVLKSTPLLPADAQLISVVISSKNTKLFFQTERLVALYLEGLIPLNVLTNIVPFKIKNVLMTLGASDRDIINAINTGFSLNIALPRDKVADGGLVSSGQQSNILPVASELAQHSLFAVTKKVASLNLERPQGVRGLDAGPRTSLA